MATRTKRGSATRGRRFENTGRRFFGDYHPRTLAIWGKFDPFFIPAGAAAYQKDKPKAVVKMLDAGHFALETNVDDIAVAIDQLLDGV